MSGAALRPVKSPSAAAQGIGVFLQSPTRPDAVVASSVRVMDLNVLIVDDDERLYELLAEYLSENGVIAKRAATGPLGLKALESGESFDAVLLDIMLPGLDGLSLLKRLREKSQIPVIMLTAKGDETDRVVGLELGADDYLAKPFHLAELTARVKAMLRRQAFDGQNALQLNNLLVKVDERSVWVNDEPLALNRKEYDMLLFFIENKNRLVSKSSMAGHVWGDHTDEADNLEFVYSQIKNLRKKLKDSGAELEIQAVYGVGYKLVS